MEAGLGQLFLVTAAAKIITEWKPDDGVTGGTWASRSHAPTPTTPSPEHHDVAPCRTTATGHCEWMITV
jgi:hypothetical protein